MMSRDLERSRSRYELPKTYSCLAEIEVDENHCENSVRTENRNKNAISILFFSTTMYTLPTVVIIVQI